MSNKNTVCVSVFGSEYTISGAENKEYIISVCDEVDRMMRAFSKGTKINPLNSAVLCAINMCDEKNKISEKYSHTNEDVDGLKKEIADLKTKIKVLKQENAYIKDELQTTKNKLSERARNAK